MVLVYAKFWAYTCLQGLISDRNFLEKPNTLCNGVTKQGDYFVGDTGLLEEAFTLVGGFHIGLPGQVINVNYNASSIMFHQHLPCVYPIPGHIYETRVQKKD